MAERAVHRFQRILGAGDIVLEIGDLRRAFRAQPAGVPVRPHVFDVDQQIGHAALDPFEMAEPGIGSVQFLHQLDDAILEMAEGVAVAGRALKLLDLVVQRLHECFEPRCRRAAAWRALGQHVCQRGNAVFKLVERIAAALAV